MKFELIKLSEVADIIVGFAFKSQDFNTNGTGVRLVRGKNITKRYLRWGEDTRWWSDFSIDLDRYYLRENDIVVGMDGSLVGKNYAKITASDLPLLLVQRVACIRAKEGVSQDYLWQIIATQFFENYIDAVKTGTTIPHISGKQIGEYEIPYCNEETQGRIASILSAIEEKIRLNTAINENLLQQALCIFASLIEDKPKNGCIGDYCALKSGFAFKSKWWQDSGVPVVKIGSINQDYLSLADCSYVSEDKVALAKDFIVSGGDLLIAMTGATIGKFTMVPKATKTILVNQRVGKFFLGDNPINRVPFIYSTLKQPDIITDIINRGQGSAQPNISASDILSIPCVIPQQTEINVFNEQTTPMFELIIDNQYENQRLATLRDTLLPKLMNGEIDVSEVRI